MRRIVLACASLLLLAASARTATLNLAWDTCAGDGGDSLRAFACASDPAPHGSTQTFVCSFVPGEDVPLFNGAEAFIGINWSSSVAPSFWNQACVGRSPISIDGASPCTNDAYEGIGFVGLAAYKVGWYWGGDFYYPGQPNEGYIDLAGVVPYPTPVHLVAGTEYFLARISFHNVTTCTGCEVPARFHFQELWLTQSRTPGMQMIRDADGRRSAYWQSASAFGAGSPTPAQPRTWGAIKALYR